MKKVKLPINIYDYQADSRKLTLQFIGALLFISFWADIEAIWALYTYPNWNILLYIFFFKMVFLIPFLYISKWLYKRYLYTNYALLVIVVPFFILVMLTFYRELGLFSLIIILIINFILNYIVYSKVLNNEIDYRKAAKNLIDKYPTNLYFAGHNFYNGAEINKNKKDNRDIVSFIPIWIFPMVALGIAELMLAYLSLKTGLLMITTVMFTVFNLFLTGAFVGSYRSKILFKTAQEMIDEEVKRRDSVRKNK